MHLKDTAGKGSIGVSRDLSLGELLSDWSDSASPQRAAQPRKLDVLLAARLTSGVGLSVLTR